jgi:hypothetical protein
MEVSRVCRAFSDLDAFCVPGLFKREYIAASALKRELAKQQEKAEMERCRDT